MEITIKGALEVAIERLGEREHVNPSLDAKLLLMKILDVDKSYIYLNLDREISGDRLERFYRLVEERASGYPLQYILKSQEFMGLDFSVEEGVLVPRPDTEILVEKLIEICKEEHGNSSFEVLEIGTGSGAIAVSLAYYLENAMVYSVDIDDTPIRVARQNAKSCGVEDRTVFLKGDVFEPIEDLEDKLFDVIVSNPPYIRTEEIERLQLEVSVFEPKLALDGGADGLRFYREIASEGTKYLRDGGILAFEIGHDQAAAVSELMKGKYRSIEVLKDYGGNDRVVIGHKMEGIS